MVIAVGANRESVRCIEGVRLGEFIMGGSTVSQTCRLEALASINTKFAGHIIFLTYSK